MTNHIVIILETNETEGDLDEEFTTEDELKDYVQEILVGIRRNYKIKYTSTFKENEAIHWRSDAAHANMLHYTNLDHSHGMPDHEMKNI